MGSVEIEAGEWLVRSHIILYGNAADERIAALIRDEIEYMWNEPAVSLKVEGRTTAIRFRISAAYQPDIAVTDILQNTDPKNNYFRVGEFVHGHISFADAIGCNTGYFKLENLYQGSTTAAHEYGHTLGLFHPLNLDLRGKGVPGIMYPRGTLVDPQYQYEPDKPPGTKGGTLHPKYRKVTETDILNLKLHKLRFSGNRAVLGEFTSIWHPDHSTTGPEDY